MQEQANWKIAVCLSLLALFMSVISTEAQEAGKVNINTADIEQLQWLPRVGPVTADNLSYAREQGFEFKSCEDLEKVKRIGPKTREVICPHVVFTGATTATGPLGSTATGAASGSKFERPKEESAN